MKISGLIICGGDESKTICDAIRSVNWVDELVIVDGGMSFPTEQEIMNMDDKPLNTRIIRKKFSGHFGDQRNFGISMCSNAWVFEIDADEVASPFLQHELRRISDSGAYDVAFIPRVNYLDGEKTEVYPDYQLRFHRSYCRWVYPLHEELVGWKSKYISSCEILHSKSTNRQDSQNEFYNTYANHKDMRGYLE